jgi:hypothetical protein
MVRVGRVLLLVVVGLGLGGPFLAGCATGNSRRDQQVAALGGRPKEPVPRGGWANYRPDRRLYEPDPARAAANPSPASRTSVGDNLR